MDMVGVDREGGSITIVQEAAAHLDPFVKEAWKEEEGTKEFYHGAASRISEGRIRRFSPRHYTECERDKG